MRRPIAVVVTAVAIGVATTPAEAAPPSTYGDCVSSGLLAPSEIFAGPANSNAALAASSEATPGAIQAAVQSDGSSRFTAGVAC